MPKFFIVFKAESGVTDILSICSLIKKLQNSILSDGCCSQNPTLILKNTEKSSKKEIEEFNKLNDPNSQKRIILLIDKGKEGWNCPSLFACALIRDASSSNNFILQASTRCLRQVKANKERAKIYLSSKNIEILDKIKISKYYYEKGYFAMIFTEGYCKHIGWDRHVTDKGE